MKRTRIACLMALFLITFIGAGRLVSQNLVINEVMASNATTIADEDGDFEDWIEIYNTGTEVVNILGYGLSDNSGNPFKWVFPEVLIQAGEFILVWASGKNRSNPGSPLHTNFAISAAGEEVLITHPSGVRIDEIGPLPLPTDISYGRQPDGGDAWFYFNEPTPGSANSSQGWEGILEAPVFSHAGGFYSNPIELSLSHPDPEAIILYTLDGSEPEMDNIGGSVYQYKTQYSLNPGDPFGPFKERSYQSHIYQQTITVSGQNQAPDTLTQISSTVQQPNYLPVAPVHKAMVVRARAYKSNQLQSAISTHTYFTGPQNTNPYALPVVSISLPEKYLFDYHIGFYTAGYEADLWRINNPDLPVSWGYPGNFNNRGVEWEHPAHFELFEQGSQHKDFEQYIGLRLHGGATRSFPMKSLRIYARSEYGKSSLDYPIFPNQNYTSYKRLILRNSGNDFPTELWNFTNTWSRTMFRDALIQTIVGGLDFDTQAYRPAVLFLNGEYWGIHNLRERYDKHYLARVYGVDAENIDIIATVSDIVEGDNVFNHETRQYIQNNGLSDDEHYNHILTRIDEKSLADFHIGNIYACNTDWPGNNTYYWRLRTSSYQADAETGNDGRFRWMMFDTDFGFGLLHGVADAAHNTLAFATAVGGTTWPNPESATFFLRKFLENNTFRAYFINRYADLLNTYFSPSRVISELNQQKNALIPEIDSHHARWHQSTSFESWLSQVQVMADFAEIRPQFARQHIEEHFDLPGQFVLNLDVNNSSFGHIHLNTIDIKAGTPGVNQQPFPWAGTYFKNVPINITAVPSDGYRFEKWTGASASDNPNLVVSPSGDMHLKAHFVKTNNPELLYFWMFDNSVPNDTPLEELAPVYQVPGNGKLTFHSALQGYPFHQGHPLWRKASMERRNAPTPINYQPAGNNGIPYDQSNMRGLQVKQPFTGDAGENTMYFHMPSDNYEKLFMRFAAINEGAATHLVVDYSYDAEGNEWTSEGLANTNLSLATNYQLFTLDFSGAEVINDNPHFVVRMRFTGPNMSADDGNRVTFNNVSLEGTVLTQTSETYAGHDGLWLGQNFPNPFSSFTSISYGLVESGQVQLYVLNMMGRRVAHLADAFQNPGTYNLVLPVEELKPGFYIIVIEQNGQARQTKMIKTK